MADYTIDYNNELLARIDTILRRPNDTAIGQ